MGWAYAGETCVQVEDLAVGADENVEEGVTGWPGDSSQADEFETKGCVGHFAVEGDGRFSLLVRIWGRALELENCGKASRVFDVEDVCWGRAAANSS